ncbi:hypothetical protein EBT16_01915 [bacterium]|nr:hypothetical protein [bacterium]
MNHTLRYSLEPQEPKPEDVETYGKDGMLERWMVYYAGLIFKHYGRDRLFSIMSTIHATFRKDW